MWPLSISKIHAKEKKIIDENFIYRACEYFFVYWVPLIFFFVGFLVAILGIVLLFVMATTTSNKFIKIISYTSGTIASLFMIIFSMCFGRLLALRD